MATSGYFDKKITAWLTLRLRWVANSQSVSDNTTNLTVTAQLVTSGGDINSTASKDISITINGTKYNSTCTVGIGRNTTKNLWAKTAPVAHNSDGSKNVALSCVVEFNVELSGKVYESATVSGTATLNNIARASTFTRSGTAIMGNAQTITITRASSSFTHKLYYTWGGTKTLIASNVGTSYTWTPLVDMAAKIPNATSGSCVLTCETYNGSTLIGTKTLTFKLSVPSSVKPTISAFTLAEAVSGLAAKFGGFVNTKSKIKYTVTAEGAQGSTIKSYAVTIAGQQLTARTATTAAINLAGVTIEGTSFTANVTVTDSRGRTASATADYTVFAYTPPQITCFEADRCDINGALNDDGEYLSIKVMARVSAVNNKNSVAYALLYKGAGETEYKNIPEFEGSGYAYADITYYTAVVFSTESSFDIRFTASDYFTTVAKTTKLSTAKPILDILFDGSGIAFNKVAEKSGAFDIGFEPIYSSGRGLKIITAELRANTALSVAQEYTQLTLTKALAIGDGFTVEDGFIKIGSNINFVKISANVAFSSIQADGNKHIRIKKNDTTVVWLTDNGTQGRNLAITVPPKIISVNEGDLIGLYAYTNSADDNIYSGSAANSYQTYLTIEDVS